MLIKSVQMSIGVLTDPAATFDRLKTEKHSAIVPFALVFCQHSSRAFVLFRQR